jgi:hypothetical protein
MSLPRPIRPYHFQADLIWWDGPFNIPNSRWMWQGPHMPFYVKYMARDKQENKKNVWIKENLKAIIKNT